MMRYCPSSFKSRLSMPMFRRPAGGGSPWAGSCRRMLTFPLGYGIFSQLAPMGWSTK